MIVTCGTCGWEIVAGISPQKVNDHKSKVLCFIEGEWFINTSTRCFCGGFYITKLPCKNLGQISHSSTDLESLSMTATWSSWEAGIINLHHWLMNPEKQIGLKAFGNLLSSNNIYRQPRVCNMIDSPAQTRQKQHGGHVMHTCICNVFMCFQRHWGYKVKPCGWNMAAGQDTWRS